MAVRQAPKIVVLIIILLSVDGCLTAPPPTAKLTPTPIACGPVPPTFNPTAVAMATAMRTPFPTFTPMDPTTPDTADTHYRRGTDYYKIGDYDHAIAELNEAIRL